MNNLDELSLIKQAQAGDISAENVLILAYSKLALVQSRSFFNPDCAYDIEDLTQLGMIGLMRAIRAYNPALGASFKTYATHCIRNTITDFLRKKHPDTVDIDGIPNELLPPSHIDPENTVIENEVANELYKDISSTLNETELEVFKLFLSSMTYEEIATELGIEKKKVDNTIYALRKKIKKLLGEKS